VTGPLGLRGGLRHLSTGLVALGWTAGRVASLADTVDAEVTRLATTLDRTADTLHDAGASASVFALTIERTPPSVRQAAEIIRSLRPNLEAIEAQLSSISILNDLGDRTAVLAERVRTGFIRRGLDDLRAVLVLTILVFVGWTAVPAIGALSLGLWLRRTLGVDPSLGE